MNFFDIPVTTIDGRDTTMADWAGHVLLIVNTASECGLTGQYEQLQQLFDDYAPRGFFVIGMPCNQFGAQEPGTDADIAQFCSTRFSVDFPMLTKADVNGPNAHPLYQFLTQSSDPDGEAGDVQWNFEKFLVSPTGEVLGRFRPRTEPDDDAIIDLLEEHLPI
ncbi:glutathione peroxidase [Corynebacterium epidermidicanis]|uniref:Glutathione peroxidase n=1 Tax=Corynebacterium epidermidicanis TaxID=1050174 RepID=A0A0G3GS29_9CORY|nr:glutathione peroxidase [Corynebacterium epidermidicanis]AKK03924.1 glutathione peroxidase [Corynebacterium epidermidicanis]